VDPAAGELTDAILGIFLHGVLAAPTNSSSTKSNGFSDTLPAALHSD
jgi:hypothetical protein